MGKRGKAPAQEPTTDQGKPFGQMSGSEKGREFDASHSDPKGYANRNFAGSGNNGQGKGKHAK